jgi:hypothetical protein
MNAPDALAFCHSILKTALQAARPEDWPPGPYVLGLWFSSLV